jgi:hypothetical protein
MPAESEIGAQPPESAAPAEGRKSVRAQSKPRSVLRAAACVYFGPFVLIGGVALFALGFGILALTVQLMAALLKHASV